MCVCVYREMKSEWYGRLREIKDLEKTYTIYSQRRTNEPIFVEPLIFPAYLMTVKYFISFPRHIFDSCTEHTYIL